MHAGPWFRHVEAFLNCVFYNFHYFPRLFLHPCQTGNLFLERSRVQSETIACIPVLPELVYLAKYVREAKLFKWNGNHWSAPITVSFIKPVNT